MPSSRECKDCGRSLHSTDVALCCKSEVCDDFPPHYVCKYCGDYVGTEPFPLEKLSGPEFASSTAGASA